MDLWLSYSIIIYIYNRKTGAKASSAAVVLKFSFFLDIWPLRETSDTISKVFLQKSNIKIIQAQYFALTSWKSYTLRIQCLGFMQLLSHWTIARKIVTKFMTEAETSNEEKIWVMGSSYLGVLKVSDINIADPKCSAYN